MTFLFFFGRFFSISIYELIYKQQAILSIVYLGCHIGDHIRKKRLDLGLTQIEVAEIIGVKESTVWNWEHGTEPELRHIPKIIEFLGYVPFECPEDTIGKL